MREHAPEEIGGGKKEKTAAAKRCSSRRKPVRSNESRVGRSASGMRRISEKLAQLGTMCSRGGTCAFHVQASWNEKRLLKKRPSMPLYLRETQLIQGGKKGPPRGMNRQKKGERRRSWSISDSERVNRKGGCRCTEGTLRSPLIIEHKNNGKGGSCRQRGGGGDSAPSRERGAAKKDTGERGGENPARGSQGSRACR